MSTLTLTTLTLPVTLILLSFLNPSTAIVQGRSLSLFLARCLLQNTFLEYKNLTSKNADNSPLQRKNDTRVSHKRALSATFF